MPADDDTADALESLRRLSAEHSARRDDGHVLDPAAQSSLALAIVEARRSWNLEDERALGLPGTADASDWGGTVARCLDRMDAALVVDAWLRQVERGEPLSHRLARDAVSRALARLVEVAPFALRLEVVLRGGDAAARGVIVVAMRLRDTPVPVEWIQVLLRILVDPAVFRDVAEDVVGIAGFIARRDPRVASLIATRARFDRARRADQAWDTPRDAQTVVSSEAIAEAVRASGCAALAPTAMLELERPMRPAAHWARALVAVAGDDGARYLDRMRGRRGWSTLHGAAPAVPYGPLEGLTDRLADVRGAALEALAGAPRDEHLQALLLAAELDRFIARQIDREAWSLPISSRWLPSFRACADANRPIDRVLARPDSRGDLFVEQLQVMRVEQLFEQLLSSDAARSVFAVSQILTPALSELAAIGVEEFARRLAPPAPLSVEERAALEAQEAEVAAGAEVFSAAR
ncbi:MAG: hypothetical protein K8W52_20265 [Deltaproteobacteria bacterium]|nr:hypothetical protein [Deltaproteobacteria bacterium]